MFSYLVSTDLTPWVYNSMDGPRTRRSGLQPPALQLQRHIPKGGPRDVEPPADVEFARAARLWPAECHGCRWRVTGAGEGEEL